MQLTKIKGMKFPDEFIVRSFFKERLFERQGNVIEYGCGNGSNLSVYYQYGWNIAGIDVSEKSLEEANANFAILSKECDDIGSYQFLCVDMLGFPVIKKYDAILFPGSLYYMSKANCLSMLARLPELIGENGAFCYFRMRRPNDYRVGISKLLADGYTREIVDDLTSEKGCHMTFWEEDDFIAEIRKHCNLSNYSNLI